MPLWKPLVALLALGSTSIAQDATLLRAKVRLREELARLPNYTCLETVAQFQGESRRKMLPLGTLRLDIVYSDHHEWYGVPGQRFLNSENPTQFIGSGMIGSGAFATTLSNVLGGAITTNAGAHERLDGRSTIKYNFRLPQLLSRFEIFLPGGSGNVGEEGSFWIDAETLDLIRLESRVNEIPSSLPLKAAMTTVGYARVRIGERDALVPLHAELLATRIGGAETFDSLDFTHCRAFSTQSAISFDPEAHDAPARSIQAAPQSLPESLLVTLELATSITAKEPTGTPITARVVGDVKSRNKLVIPNGSLVRGHIRSIDQHRGALEFTAVETSNGPLPFFADLLRVDRGPLIHPILSERIAVPCSGDEKCKDSGVTVSVPELLGVAALAIDG